LPELWVIGAVSLRAADEIAAKFGLHTVRATLSVALRAFNAVQCVSIDTTAHIKALPFGLSTGCAGNWRRACVGSSRAVQR